MLYRHFPKIANKEISILALALGGTADPVLALELLRRAAELGINLLDAGTDPGRIALFAKAAAGEGITLPAFRLCEFAADMGAEPAPAALEAFLDGADGNENDFLAIRVADAARFTALEKAGVIDLAADAKRNGRCGLLGFSCPADAALVTTLCDAYDGWDFFRTDFSFPDSFLLPAIRHAALREIGFIASDPFAGGKLQNAAPAIHELYYRAPVPRSHEEWALRGIWEMQETVTVALEPKSADELLRCAIFAGAGRPNSLTGREMEVLAAAGKLSGYSSANP